MTPWNNTYKLQFYNSVINKKGNILYTVNFKITSKAVPIQVINTTGESV